MQRTKRLTKLKSIELDIERGKQKVYENDHRNNIL